MAAPLIHFARAPVRLDFAGGWTDVAPFPERSRGSVVNATIRLSARVQLEFRKSGYRLEARDLGREVELTRVLERPSGDDLPLLTAALRVFQPPPCEIITSSDAPPGSGLGTSGAMGVAIAAVLAKAAGHELSRGVLAERAWHLEAVEANIPGGRQDQYAAALGGFHHFTFDRNGVHWTRLAIDPYFAEDLRRRVVVCYTGQSRLSGDTIARVVGRYAAGDPEITAAFEGMAAVADRMAAALVAGDLELVGRLLSENWAFQQRLDPGMRTEAMARLERAMTEAGALGGKAAGAGAGGAMFFVMGSDGESGARAARESGALVLPCLWEPEGVVTW